MLSLIIGLLTFVLVFICAILVLLILAQLPKKDAGAGLAFGAGTAEAIFGAGAGTPLAQITKYCAGIFLGLSLTLSALNAYRSNQSDRLIEEEAARQAVAAPAAVEEPATDPSAEVTSIPTDLSPSEQATTEEATTNEGEEGEATTPELSQAAEPTGDAEPLVPAEGTPATQPNPNN